VSAASGYMGALSNGKVDGCYERGVRRGELAVGTGEFWVD